MDKVSVLKIRDKDGDQEALAIVRSVNGFVALTLSLEHEADVEVAFTPSECNDLVQRLQQAISDAEFHAEGESWVSSTLQTGEAPTRDIAMVNSLGLDRGGKVKNG